jgi:hypothetical protein
MNVAAIDFFCENEEWAKPNRKWEFVDHACAAFRKSPIWDAMQSLILHRRAKTILSRFP